MKKSIASIARISRVYLLIFWVLPLVSCGSTVVTQGTKTESLYERVMRTGKIRGAYAVYPPLCLKEPNSGQLSGTAIDALRLVGGKLGLEVELTEEVGWGNVIEGLKAGRYDVMATSVWPNANRAKQAAFSKPLCYNPIFAYSRADDNRFVDHPERINASDVTIATVDGTTSTVIAEADFPKAKLLSMPQLTDIAQTFLNVSTRKADIVISEPDLAYKFMQNNPGKIKNISVSKPLRIFPCCWMYNRGEVEFKSMVDTVLDEVINSGAMDKIIDKYQPSPDSVFRVALPYKVPGGEHQGRACVAGRGVATP